MSMEKGTVSKINVSSTASKTPQETLALFFQSHSFLCIAFALLFYMSKMYSFFSVACYLILTNAVMSSVLIMNGTIENWCAYYNVSYMWFCIGHFVIHIVPALIVLYGMYTQKINLSITPCTIKYILGACMIYSLVYTTWAPVNEIYAPGNIDEKNLSVLYMCVLTFILLLFRY